MPGMTGIELANEIGKRWPRLPVLLATGYAELPEGGGAELPRLSKPYHQDELAAQVSRLLDHGWAPNVVPLGAARRCGTQA
jgi:CheY-like chemotaxis protein